LVCDSGVTTPESILTMAPPRLTPLMVMIVPPEIGPCEGETLSIRGACANAAAHVRTTASEARMANVK